MRLIKIDFQCKSFLLKNISKNHTDFLHGQMHMCSRNRYISIIRELWNLVQKFVLTLFDALCCLILEF